MIQFHDVSKAYPGGHLALSGVSLQIPPGEFAFVAGHSGAGKTTLMKLIMLEERASRGQVIVDGVNLNRAHARQIPRLRRKIGMVFQDFRLIETRTVYANVALRLEVLGLRTSYIKKKVRVTLRNLGIEKYAEAFPPQLSGGQQQRVAIARALVADPDILLADEPTGNLDLDLSRAILHLLLEINQRGTTVLMATHNQELIQENGHRLIRLDQGRLVEA